MNEKPWSLPLRYLVLGFLIIAIAIGLWYIRSVLQPFIIAAFIAYLINPAVNFLTRHTRISHRTSVIFVFIITILLFIGAPASITFFLDELQQIIRDIGVLFNEAIVWLSEVHTLADFPLDFRQLASNLEEIRSTFLPSLAENALKLLEQTSMGALWIIVTMVTVYYFLSEWPNLWDRFLHSFPADSHPELDELYRRIRRVWMNYLRGQILLMVIVAIVFSIAWSIIGIPGALVLGIVAGFLTLIPDVGPFLAAILAAGVALLEGSSWIELPNFGVAVIVIVIYLILIGVKNFWLRPFIMGRSVHMPEPLVFIFIILATVLWGILGALLVIPVAASLFILFDYLRRRALNLPPFPDAMPEPKTEHLPQVPRLRKTRK